MNRKLLLERWTSIEKIMNEYAQVAGLTSMGLTVLGIIYGIPQGCTQKQICERSHYNKQTVNMIIKSLWEQGYVELTEMKEDRRNKQVKLSADGKEYADKVIGFMLEAEMSPWEKLTENQQKLLMEFGDAYEQGYQKAIAALKRALNKEEKRSQVE